jgi:aminoglycoside phosphotransferase (APT) family kinase protein
MDADRLAAHLALALESDPGVVEVERIVAGHSNLTYIVRCAAGVFVLRRPPAGPLPPTAHDVLREFRVLQLLRDTEARAPEPVLACDDVDVIGAPFYLMRHVDGVVLREPPDGAVDRRTIGLELADALAELHAVDWKAAGFAGIARPGAYLERQLRRWTSQWEHNRTRSLPEVDRLGGWLHEHVPTQHETTVVHGDYKLDNVIYRLGPGPPRALAIVDWEMATLGDPLADLGYMTALWTDPGEDPAVLLDLGEATSGGGFPTRDELVERYAQRTGRAVGALRWYQALAIWKLAVLLEGSYKRHLAGTTDDPFFARLERGIPTLARHGWALATT